MSSLSMSRRGGKAGVFVALTCTAALLLTACGRSDADSDPVPTDSAAIDDSPATGVVDVWAPAGDANTLDALLDDFRSENPDATVNVTVIPNNEYPQKIQAAIASDTLPDVALVRADGSLLSGTWLPVPDGLVDLDDFFPGTLALGQVEGSQYLVPWYQNVRLLVYRSDIAKLGGVEAPSTWNEWVPFLEGLRAGGAPQPFGTDVNWDSNTGLVVATLGFSAGADILSADGMSWEIDTPEMRAAFTQYASFFDDALTSPDGPGFLDQVSTLVSGEVGSLVTGPWVVAQLDDAAGEEWVKENIGFAVLPAGPAGSIGALVGGGWAVSESSDNTESAWKVIRYLGQVETQIAQYQAFGSLPPRVTAWETGGLTADPRFEPFFTQMETSVAPPNVATWNQITAMLGGEAERLVRGGVSVDVVLADAQAKADSIGTGK